MKISVDNNEQGCKSPRAAERLLDAISSGKYNAIIYTAAFIFALLYSTRSGAAEPGLEIEVFSWL
jgi:hypothetical protein